MLLTRAGGFYGPAAGGGGGSLIFTWRSAAVQGGVPAPNASMFTSQAIGTASSDRIVVVAISWTGTSSTNMDIPSNGVTIGGVTATQAVNSRPSSKGHAIFYALVTSGTTATIGITGYTNGWIDEIIINTASITGSATASVASTNVTPAYSSGLSTSPSITIPTGGVGAIAALSINNGGVSTSTWSGATKDNDQYDSNVAGITGTMAHITASGTVSETGVNGGGPTGWVVAVFQP